MALVLGSGGDDTQARADHGVHGSTRSDESLVHGQSLWARSDQAGASADKKFEWSGEALNFLDSGFDELSNSVGTVERKQNGSVTSLSEVITVHRWKGTHALSAIPLSLKVTVGSKKSMKTVSRKQFSV